MQGGNTPQQRITEQERAQAQRAVGRWRERIDDGYLALEKKAIGESEYDHSGFVKAQASSEVAHQEAEAYKASLRVAGNQSVASGETAEAVSTARAVQDVEAESQGQLIKDGRRQAMATLGQDVALETSSGLREMAEVGSTRAQAAVKADLLKSQSKAQMKGQIIQSAMGAAALRNEGYRFDGPFSIAQTHEKGWNGKALPTVDAAGNPIQAKGRMSSLSILRGV